MQDFDNNYLRAGVGHASNSQNRQRREKFKQIAAIVAASPGITSGEIAAQYLPPKQVSWYQARQRLTGLLLDMCLKNRIKCVDNQYFPVETGT